MNLSFLIDRARAFNPRALARRKTVPWMVLAAVLLLAGLGRVVTAPNALAVLVDGEQVAVVADQAVVDAALASLTQEQETLAGQQVRYDGSVSVEKTRVAEADISSVDNLAGALRGRLRFFAGGVGIVVDGVEKAVLPDRAAAEQVLEQVQQSFLPPPGSERKIELVKFEEQVKIEPRQVRPEELVSVAAAVNLLRDGAEKTETYTVKEGDSLWTIARARNMWPEDLFAANPKLQSERLRIGQELKLVRTEPMVHVTVTWQEIMTETIPYPTQVQSNAELYRGQDRVAEVGVNGQKTVTYRYTSNNGIQVKDELLAEKIVKEPVPRIINRGTKVMVASRGGGGSGVVAWPLQGRITSGFGPRWGRMHLGIDIDGRTGDPVYAAEGGTVIFAGWEGSYGRLLTIDHGDGLVTRYGHLSAFKASVGDKVSRGDGIGLVGATGNATGSSLHFEVWINGVAKNPLNYLR